MQANNLLYLSLIILVVGCNRATTVEEYKKWVENEENGLKRKKKIGEFLLEMQYKPATYIIIRETGNGLNKDFQKEVSAMGNTEYFDLMLSLEGGGDILQEKNIAKDRNFYDKQYYLTFGFQNDIWLEINSKRIPCSLYHFERTYDLKAKRKIVMAFDSQEKNTDSDRILVINGEKLGFGVVKTLFKIEDILSVPELANKTL